MLRLPLESDLAAATRAAHAAGLGPVTPEVLHLGNHTTARLSPLPIVARIASGTSFDFSPDSLMRELAIAAHLASRDAPTVRPVARVSPAPYVEDECVVTLWELVEGRGVGDEREEMMAAESLKRVHSGLADLDVDLPSFLEKVESCEAILSNPAEAPQLGGGDRAFLDNLYRTLRRKLDAIGGPWQPLHGDAHIGNVLITGLFAIWMDLEAVCLGPVEWDIATLPAATWPAFIGADQRLLRLLADVRSLCVAVWCWAEFGRSAATNEAAVDHLGELKRKFG